MDEAPINYSSQSSTCSDAFESSSKLPHYYEHVEAINFATNQYHRNKLLTDNNFTIRHPEDDLDSPTETYNREIIKALQRGTRSPGSNSIGSFLSMASVRSFPKCTVPEPLSRVLEPLSVTHLDASDDGVELSKIPRVIEAKYKNDLDQTIKCSSKIYKIVHNEAPLQRSQSDGADPGVIGPVVWEIHKKQIEGISQMYSFNKRKILISFILENTSPYRDPIQTRNRFEGLLEGAIKMYSNDINQEVCNEINFTSEASKAAGVIKLKDRGKSAVPIR